MVIKLKIAKTRIFEAPVVTLSVCKLVWGGGECGCPPVRNDIVTPRHLLGVKMSLVTKGLIILLSRFIP